MSEMFVEVKLGGGAEIFSGLIDSGNGFRSLISLKAFKRLNVPLKHSCSRAVSVDNSSVDILGKTPPIELKFVGFSKSFFIEFEVVKHMRIDFNLGYKFLSENGAVILFCKNLGNNLALGDMCIPLKTQCVVKDYVNNIIDEQPLSFEQQVKDLPGINFTEGEGGSFDTNQKFVLYNAEKVKLAPLQITPVRVNVPSNIVGNVYVTPNNIKCYMNKVGLLPLEAVYFKNNDFYVNILNTNEVFTSLPYKCKVGFGFTIKDSIIKNKGVISVIDKLSTEELRSRIAYISDELKLKDNPITMNNSKLRANIINIFLDNFEAIAKNSDDIGTTDLIKFKINLKDGAEPVNAKNFPLNPDQSAALRLQIEKWLSSGVIKPTISSWNSPIFSVKKKTGVPGKFDLRFVLDFRKLNSLTKDEVYPLPNIESNISKLGGANLFSTLDCVQAYHTVPVEEQSQEFLAFSSEDGSFTFARMPFGCKNSAHVFQRLINKALSLIPGIAGYCLSYLDDLIIFSNSIISHLDHLKQVVGLMNRCGLKLKLSKCDIFKSSVKYLGHIIGSKNITMDPYYLLRIKEWVRPRTGKEMQSFLGFLNYYRSYIPQFAAVTYKLDNLRKEQIISWSSDLNECFLAAKDMFHDSVSRGYPNWDHCANKFILDIDFSKNYLSGILSQNQKGVEVLLGAFSRRCSVAESRYSSHKGEACALVFAMEKFSHFLRFKPFIVRTDSRSVLTTSSWRTRLLTGVTSRWLDFISTFDFIIEHRAGTKHKNADILSRVPTNDGIDLPVDYKFDPITKANSKYEDTIYSVAQDKQHVAQSLDVNAWVQATNEDITLKMIKDWILLTHKPTTQERIRLTYRGRQLANLLPHLVIEKGLVIFVQPDREKKYPVKRTVVPLSLYNTVFELCHNSAFLNHRGILNTLNFLQERFVMPYARKFIQARINNCVKCFDKVKNKPKSSHRIEFSDYASIPMEVLTIDTIGPLNRCVYKGETVQHILIMVDSCTRYMWLYPLKDVKTETIINAICEEYIPMFTLFRYLKSDRGPCFTSKIWEGVMKRFGVNLRHSVVRNPNSNHAERYNQMVYSLFKTNNDFLVNNWASKLKFIMLAHNCSKSSRTSFSPYFLLFQRDPILPLDLIDPVGEDKSKLHFHSQSFDNFVYNLEKTFEILKKRTENYLNVENASRTTNELYINSIVYYFEDIVKVGTPRKLSSFYLGPFIITHKFSNTLYELTPIPPNTCKRVITAARDKIRKIDGKINLGDETLGFNVKPSKYINIDSDIQLSNLDNNRFITHMQNRHKYIQEPLQRSSNLHLRGESDSESDDEIVGNESLNSHNELLNNNAKKVVTEPNTSFNSDSQLSAGSNKDAFQNIDTGTVIAEPNTSFTHADKDVLLNSRTKEVVTEPKNINDNMLSNQQSSSDNTNESILVHRNPIKSSSTFIQLSRKNKTEREQEKLSLKDIFVERSLRSNKQKKLFSFDINKPFTGFK